MTVKQAIAALQKCPPDAVLVMIDRDGACEVDIKGVQAALGSFRVDRGLGSEPFKETLPGAKVVVVD